jgi:hypothetical protein
MITLALLVTLSLFALILIRETTERHEIGWEWDTNVTPVVENRTEDYSDNVGWAVDDYDSNTDLSVDQCEDNGNCGIIIHDQGNWGNSGWDGYAHALSDNEECIDWETGQWTGNCDDDDNRVDFAWILYNDFYGWYELPSFGARHEMGHVFGLAHTNDDCDEWSVMREGECRPNVPISLTSHDINDDINVMY